MTGSVTTRRAQTPVFRRRLSGISQHSRPVTCVRFHTSRSAGLAYATPHRLADTLSDSCDRYRGESARRLPEWSCASSRAERTPPLRLRRTVSNTSRSSIPSFSAYSTVEIVRGVSNCPLNDTLEESLLIRIVVSRYRIDHTQSCGSTGRQLQQSV